MSSRQWRMRALVAAGTLAMVAGGVAAGLARARGSATPKRVFGVFPNGMAYLTMGNGPRTLLWIPGG